MKRCLVVLLAFVTTSALAAPRKVIIDDDGFGIWQWMVLQSPDAEVLGLTVVTGDGWRDEVVAKALRALEMAGRTDVPVVPGAVYPLVNTEQATDRWEALYG